MAYNLPLKQIIAQISYSYPRCGILYELSSRRRRNHCTNGIFRLIIIIIIIIIIIKGHSLIPISLRSILILSSYLQLGLLKALSYRFQNKKNQICGLQLPRERHRSNRLLQLTDRWQFNGIMRLALCSLKSNNFDFLNQIRYFSTK